MEKKRACSLSVSPSVEKSRGLEGNDTRLTATIQESSRLRPARVVRAGWREKKKKKKRLDSLKSVGGMEERVEQGRIAARGLNRRGEEAVSVVAIGRDAESTLIVNRADCPSAGGVQTSSTKAVIPGPGPAAALPKTIIHSTSPRSQGRVSHHVTTYCEDLSALREKPAGISSTFHAGKSSGSILSRPLLRSPSRRLPFSPADFYPSLGF